MAPAHRQSNGAPESTVTLPSLHEMFPDYIPQRPPTTRSSRSHTYPQRSDARQDSYLRPPALEDRSIPAAPRGQPSRHLTSPSSVASPAAADTRRNCFSSSSSATSSSTLSSEPKSHSSTSPAKPPASNNFTFHNHTPNATCSLPSPSFVMGSPNAHNCSFDVLRSNPTGSSLEHITSSSTFPNNRVNPASNHVSPAGIANGSSPLFRVTLDSHNQAASRSQDRRRDRDTASQRDWGKTKLTSVSTVLKSDSPPPSPTSYSTILSFPASPDARSGTHERQRPAAHDLDSDGGDISSGGGDSGKKHVCPECSKRFNRPSSLRIHFNTHTGVTPFRCPWPECGREFNVNSNMRRHLRNHTTPGFSRSQSSDSRQRRKRRGSAANLIFIDPEGPSLSTSPRDQKPFMTSPPISCITMSEESADDASNADDRDMDIDFGREEEDELQDSESPHDYRRPSISSASGYSSSRSPPPQAPLNPSYQFSQSHVRAQPLNHSRSTPFARSFDDPRVSTSLRPAFPTKPLARADIKQEQW